MGRKAFNNGVNYGLLIYYVFKKRGLLKKGETAVKLAEKFEREYPGRWRTKMGVINACHEFISDREHGTRKEI